MQKLDRNAPLTLTYQLTEILRGEIKSSFSAGDMLPTEKELVKIYDVSSITVRNALENLVNEGLVYRKRGKGTFVAEKKISSDVARLQSGTQLFQESGMVSRLVILDQKQIKASSSMAKLLHVEEGTLLNVLTRQRSLEGVPYSLETSIVSQRDYPDIFEHYTGGSLYEYLDKTYGITVTRSPQQYTAIALNSKFAHLLGQPIGSPAILLKGLVYDQNDKLVSYEESVYRSDKFEIWVEANSDHPTTKKLIEEGAPFAPGIDWPLTD